MYISDFQREAAEALIEQARDRRVSELRAALQRDGRERCEDCGAAISPARRHAYPSATRCIDCQEIVEREVRR